MVATSTSETNASLTLTKISYLNALFSLCLNPSPTSNYTANLATQLANGCISKYLFYLASLFLSNFNHSHQISPSESNPHPVPISATQLVSLPTPISTLLQSPSPSCFFASQITRPSCFPFPKFAFHVATASSCTDLLHYTIYTRSHQYVTCTRSPMHNAASRARQPTPIPSGGCLVTAGMTLGFRGIARVVDGLNSGGW
ncbi:hypothetical protein Pint_29942 [Pistacia integerrima]|uniref:Uncharacterized protein n=1 Tax=Pistacia integerrima TaxID=434235 RepID=A0ACC0X1A6_9ROSI|nr:hypothetical protein Pint_29942 [Pistacia integerrima]